MSLDNLPVEWSVTGLESLSEFIIGGDWGKDLSFADESYIDAFCIRGSEFKNWKTDKGKTAVPRKLKISSLNTRRLKVGDILVEISGGGPDQPVGRTVYIEELVFNNLDSEDIVCTNFLRLFRPISSINAKYLNFYLSFFYKTPEIVNYQSGSNNLRNLQFKDYLKLEIPMAPLAEQQEIVRQLDVMLAQVEQIKARLDAIPALLKKFRQSVLADAVSGKLTEEWRLENINDDLNSELIQIKKNRESKVVGSQKRSLDFSVDENLKPDVDLPDSWKLVGLGDLIEFLTDYHANGSYEKLRDHVTLLDEENYACMIRATNFEKNNFDDLLIYIDQTAYEFLTKTKLFGNEILISKIGNAGSVYLMPKLNRPCSLAMNLFMLRFDEDLVNPRYINYFLISIFGEKYISQYVRGVATKSIDKKSVRNVFVHYPCFNEQNQIVKVIDQLFEYVNRIEETVKSAQKRVNLLTQSILAKAFSGELTAEWREQHQDLITGVNSAEALLAKIQAEREVIKPVKKAKKVK
ncbi:restriction endonuclease subunit S [Acinetobacter sp. YH12090]|uniref:restriction endonuclease subunit S n=1 Tax=Acinetobacter sp. YH12090 TaxID=2601081 RepID=UPI0015D4356D|nr:restriction endonuclease subunit S [Acinetobacter sp. YH12090]